MHGDVLKPQAKQGSLFPEWMYYSFSCWWLDRVASYPADRKELNMPALKCLFSGEWGRIFHFSPVWGRGVWGSMGGILVRCSHVFSLLPFEYSMLKK